MILLRRREKNCYPQFESIYINKKGKEKRIEEGEKEFKRYQIEIEADIKKELENNPVETVRELADSFAIVPCIGNKDILKALNKKTLLAFIHANHCTVLEWTLMGGVIEQKAGVNRDLITLLDKERKLRNFNNKDLQRIKGIAIRTKCNELMEIYAREKNKKSLKKEVAIC